jgi:hypothetical protein
MEFTQIILIIIIILAFMILNFKNKQLDKLEHYDTRYSNMTIDDCAKFCKTTAGCYGFSYDGKNKICYGTDSVLSYNGPQEDSIYGKEFREDHIYCNKFNPILIPTKTPGFVNRKSNAIFSCGENIVSHPQLYIHDKNRLIHIEEGQNPDFITSIDEYNVNFYRWPTNKFNQDQLDLLRENRKRQLYNDEYVSSLDRMRNQKADPLIITSEEKPKTKTIDDNIKDVVKKMQYVTTIPLTDILQIEGFKSDANKKKYDFRVHSEQNQGQYYLNHKCVKDISLKGCLEFCKNRKDCDGVEYNPKFFNSHGVCCPFRTSEVLIEREKMYKHGHFFKKKKEYVDPDTLEKSIHLII